MEVGVPAAATTSFGGSTFHFCSVSCKTAFDQSPADYQALAQKVPAALSRLPELARNLWWTWHFEASALFAGLNPRPGEPSHHNPLELLSSVEPEALEARARDPGFREGYRRTLAAFDADMAPREPWAPRPDAVLRDPIAYFSAEFGVHSALPVYSGGLGVLAGDMAKEASDLGVPLIGIGFMYPQGYFHQHVSASGRQEEIYERLRRPIAPALPACTETGRPCAVAIPLPDRVLHAAVWIVRVGRVPLYLMDTDLEVNPLPDRELSARLYGGDREVRLRQEILLGIGGVRLLRALGMAPAVWHANEGHAAFMMVERVREVVEGGQSFGAAVEQVRASTVFTTHTPVAAGHDVFPTALLEKYLAAYWPALGLTREQFLALGSQPGSRSTALNMTALALRLSGHRNAVSRRHGEVSRRMWRGLWPALPESEIPIAAVTNGVHIPSWVAPALQRLYRTYLGEDWLDRHDAPELWARLDAVPDGELWRAHRIVKDRLLAFVHDRARRRWADECAGGHQPVAGGVFLEPEALTLGFARRFATYKRAVLILRDPDRLRAILTDDRRPVQLIFAGKAHPADEPGKQVLQAVYGAAMDRAYQGRIAFVEDYDIHVAQHLVQGVDAWINTPRPPLEASGTSGQKAAVNGVPSVSVLDGWWAEAYDGTNGWAVGEPETVGDDEARDAADAESLYRVLETQIVPLYYERDRTGRPGGWLRVMRRAIQTVAWRFSARRMVKEYVERLYAPAARRAQAGE